MTAAVQVQSEPINRRVLDFEAPYLEQKYVLTGLVETREQAATLFLELKKYLLLAATHPTPLPMMSALVDAAWHQFILYSAEYERFCLEMFGGPQHHSPRGASDGTANGRGEGLVVSTFVDLYRKHFGPLPDVWHNERCLRPDTRLVHADGARFSVQTSDGQALLWRERNPRQIVCRASSRAVKALEFIADHPRFLLREVSGLRSAAEQLALVAPLVRWDILNIAP
jgi:hypothetical protein